MTRQVRPASEGWWKQFDREVSRLTKLAVDQGEMEEVKRLLASYGTILEVKEAVEPEKVAEMSSSDGSA